MSNTDLLTNNLCDNVKPVFLLIIYIVLPPCYHFLLSIHMFSLPSALIFLCTSYAFFVLCVTNSILCGWLTLMYIPHTGKLSPLWPLNRYSNNILWFLTTVCCISNVETWVDWVLFLHSHIWLPVSFRRLVCMQASFSAGT